MVLLAIVLAGWCTGCDSAPDAGGSAQPDIETAAMEFSRCMRDRGYEVPDPTFDDDGLPRFEQVPGMVQNPEFEAARQVCVEPLDAALEAAGVPNDKPKDNQALLPFSRCLREQGIEFPDPVPDQPVEVPKDVFHSPAWAPALAACEDTLPEEWRDAFDTAPGVKGAK